MSSQAPLTIYKSKKDQYLCKYKMYVVGTTLILYVVIVNHSTVFCDIE